MSLFGEACVETTTTTGTGTLSLDGAAAGFQTLVAGVGSGNSAFYFMRGNAGSADENEWESGYGTVTSGAPDTITRTALQSSNSDNLVNWSAGTKTVFSAPLADVLNSILNTHAGTSRPAWLPTSGVWLDTTSNPWFLKCYDGGADIVLGEFNITTNIFTPWNAGAALTLASLGGADLTGANTFTGINTFSAQVRWAKGADVASAATLVLGTDGNAFDVTGTTGITAITVAANTWFLLQMNDAVEFTHHATNLILQGGADYTSAAGDILICYAYAANQVRLTIHKAAGTPVKAGGILQVIQKDIAETSTATTTPALDTSVPLVSEGAEIVSQAITPRDTSSRVKISVNAFLTANAALHAPFAIFRGSTCIAAAVFSPSAASAYAAVSMCVVDSPALDTAVTYSVRFGVNGNTAYINRKDTGSLFGGAVNIANGLILEEIAG